MITGRPPDPTRRQAEEQRSARDEEEAPGEGRQGQSSKG